MALLQKWNDEGLLAKAGFMNSSELGREMTLDALPNKTVSVAHVMKSLKDAGVNQSQMSEVEGKLHKSHGGGKKGKTKALLNQLLSLLGKKKEKHNRFDTPDKSWQELELLQQTEAVKMSTELREAATVLRNAVKNTDRTKLPAGMTDAINKMLAAAGKITEPIIIMNELNVIIKAYIATYPGKAVKKEYTMTIHADRAYNHASVTSAILSFVTRYIGTNWKGEEKKHSLYLDLKTEFRKISKTKHTISLLSQAIANKKPKTGMGAARATHTGVKTINPATGMPYFTTVREGAGQAFDHDSYSISSPFE